MLITGGQGGRINHIGLQLGSMSTNMQLLVEPFNPDYDTNHWKCSNDILIHFQDSRELDIFIHALQKFRAKNNAYIGDWVEVKE